jgi:hypothetical protein
MVTLQHAHRVAVFQRSFFLELPKTKEVWHLHGAVRLLVTMESILTVKINDG